jgi:catechol 2,3-dioxygenase-like lactoylglutathione lyase family enzyme
MGRPAEEIAESVHLSLAFGSGARLDLFETPTGSPPPSASHPHIAFRVSPDEMLRWKARLNDRGVPTFGPTRLGPPGQASLYFNDPSGNHLELTTLGFTGETPVGAPDMEVLQYEWRRS